MLKRAGTLALAMTTLGWLHARAQDGHQLDAWASLAPIVSLDEEERRRLDDGHTVVKVLEATERSHLSVFAASRIKVTAQRFTERIRNTPRLWRGPKVPRTGMFGISPRAEDVAAMTLPPDDVHALRRCRPGACDVKLSSAEMARIHEAIRSEPPNWETRVQHEFRQIVLARIGVYRRGGLSALDSFDDHDRSVDPQAAFSRLIAQAQGMTRLAPELTEYLEQYPRRPLPADCEEFLYWLETVHPPKPTIQAWHVIIHRRPLPGAADVMVLSRQIFATHYVNGALAMTALVGDEGGPQHMLYLNRISADGLGGFLSGIRRFFIERRVKSGARAAFDWMRSRIEAVNIDLASGGRGF